MATALAAIIPVVLIATFVGLAGQFHAEARRLSAGDRSLSLSKGGTPVCLGESVRIMIDGRPVSVHYAVLWDEEGLRVDVRGPLGRFFFPGWYLRCESIVAVTTDREGDNILIKYNSSTQSHQLDLAIAEADHVAASLTSWIAATAPGTSAASNDDTQTSLRGATPASGHSIGTTRPPEHSVGPGLVILGISDGILLIGCYFLWRYVSGGVGVLTLSLGLAALGAVIRHRWVVWRRRTS